MTDVRTANSHIFIYIKISYCVVCIIQVIKLLICPQTGYLD